MFGLVTRRELDRRLLELKTAVDAGRRFQDDIAYEWAKWFNKFRSLYALLLKREKKLDEAPETTEEGAGPTDASDTSVAAPARQPIPFPKSRRGF